MQPNVPSDAVQDEVITSFQLSQDATLLPYPSSAEVDLPFHGGKLIVTTT